jgi:hypothetical protein
MPKGRDRKHGRATPAGTPDLRREYFCLPGGCGVGAVMRITFFTEQAARAAVEIWERHGFAAARTGTVVVTDCPTLWAVPIIHRVIGFNQVERFDVLSPAKPASSSSTAAQEGSATLGRLDVEACVR